MPDLQPRMAIEVPVVKGGWLIPCIESVLAQTETSWELLLAWDCGDDLSRRILEQLAARNNPRIRVFFHDTRVGIAENRRFLTAHSTAPWILPLDDDDLLVPEAIARFVAAAEAMPWASLLRARRGFIDDTGQRHAMDDWFPFAPRQYVEGMTADLYNHAQPVALKRSAYAATHGWEGFEDFLGAGEDCDMVAKLEEHGDIGLLDETLYLYRVHDKRASDSLGAPAAEEMWRRIADRTMQRRGLPLRRTSQRQPFAFTRLETPPPTPADVSVVIAHYPTAEEELPYPWRRPSEEDAGHTVLAKGHEVRQPVPAELGNFDRVEVCCFSDGPVSGKLTARLVGGDGRLTAITHARLWHETMQGRYVSLPLRSKQAGGAAAEIIVSFQPHAYASATPVIAHARAAGENGILLRLYRAAGDETSERLLTRCIDSAHANGVPPEQVHVVAQRASSAANRNTGLRLCNTRFVCLLDDDAALATADTLNTLLAGMRRIDVHLAMPKILGASGEIYCAAPYFGADGLPRPHGLGEADGGHHDYEAEVPWLPTTCLLLERNVVSAAGYFDEAYTGSQLEDVDFCLKARSRGFRCGYVGGAAALHDNLQRNFAFGENVAYFKRRWAAHPELLAAATPEGSS